MSGLLFKIPDAFHLPRPNWSAIRKWVEANIAVSNREAAWAEIAEGWLQTLNSALGDSYQVIKTKYIYLFASKENDQVELARRYAELGLTVIIEALGDIACESWLGPLVIFLFDDADTYSSFVAPADPEIETIRSAGVCFRHGYVHIAIRPCPTDSLYRIMLHEITHACLAHVSLPLWLEEGITQLAEEEAVVPHGRFVLTSEDAERLRGYWREVGLGEFWWGSGFHQYDSGQGNCYQTAQVLFRLLLSDYRRQLTEFVRHASQDDAGDSAAREFLGISLGQLASRFLGAGNWDPVPVDPPTFCRRGIFHLVHGEFDRAISDFDKGIEIDAKYAYNYSYRGFAHHQLDRYDAAIADYEQAIKLAPQDFDAFNMLAWHLSTCPDDMRRNGEKAVELATTACELSAYGLWFCLDSLAAAYAECGDFEEAKRWARETTQLAPAGEREGCKQRMRMYKEGKPYRELVKRSIKTFEVTNPIAWAPALAPANLPQETLEN